MSLQARTLAAALTVGALVITAAVYADCCPCPIARGGGGAPPNPNPNPAPNPNPNPDMGELQIPDKDKEKPDPNAVGDGEGIATLGGNFVEETNQQAVIAWNGKEEVLVLTTNERFRGSKDTAVLHFMPLPGKPKDIQKAEKDTFKKAKKLVLDKLMQEGALTSTAGLGVFMRKTIGAHNIFVWKIEDAEQFERRVQAYVAKEFGPGNRAYITPEMMKVMRRYFERGYRYFAFDLVIMSKEKTTKEAIAYHFESPKGCFYPLVISSGGAKGTTVVDLVVFSKGELEPIHKIEGMRRLGNRSVNVSYDELAGVSKHLSKLFEQGATLRGRIIQIEGKIEHFENDFAARAAR
jgi:hypothetical protein